MNKLETKLFSYEWSCGIIFYILPMTILIGQIISFPGYVQTGNKIIFFCMVPWDHLNLQDNVCLFPVIILL